MDLNALTQQMASLQAGYVDPTTKYNQIFDSLGGGAQQQRVGALQTALHNNENLITGLPANILQRTQNSDVTQGQNARLNAMEVAPLNATETSLGQRHGEAQTDYSNILSNATNQAGLYQKGFETQRDTLSQQIATAQAAAAAAEAKRQFDAQMAAQATASASKGSGGGGSGGGSAAKAPTSVQRAGGGYNFTDGNGNPISAGRYAQLTGASANSVFVMMANHGDIGAQDVLKHGGSSKYYHALTWGQA